MFCIPFHTASYRVDGHLPAPSPWLAQDLVRIVHRSPTDQREDRTQREQLLHWAGDRVGVESHQIGQSAWFQGAAAVALPIKQCTACGIQPDRGILVNRILWPLDADFFGSARHKAPDGLQRIKQTDRIIRAGGELPPSSSHALTGIIWRVRSGPQSLTSDPPRA